MPLNLHEGEEPQVITKLDPNSPLFDQALAVAKAQELAVQRAAEVLSETFDAKAEAVKFDCRNEVITVMYIIRKTSQPETPSV